MIDWRAAVQAMVNTSRSALATELGYHLPPKAKDERRFWKHIGWHVIYGRLDKIDKMDAFRITEERRASGSATTTRGPEGTLEG